MRSLYLLLLTACVADVDGVDDGIDNTDGDDTDFQAETAGSPKNLDVGFDGPQDQFGYIDKFFALPGAVKPATRLCHTYVSWNVGNQAPNAGDINDPATRAYLDDWLAKAEGHCDDALISFKAMAHGDAPKETPYRTSIANLAATNWKTEAGFSGTLSFTAWNEPNNAADDGSGLGIAIDPRQAARYYLIVEHQCRLHGCKAAAGDFASNGDMWNAFEFNCENDNVPASQLCDKKSSVNTAKAAASYLDKYKNEIANRATDYGMPKGFRPEYFAFHGWHDINDYLNDNNHCSEYGTCALRRIMKSLGGSWGGVALWDTETGVGQNQDAAPTDHMDQCGAAFLLRVNTLTNRVKRMYITRLHRGIGQLFVGTAARPAASVLAQRDATASGCP